MNKKAWPYIGSTENEMGSMSPSGNPDKDIQMDSYEKYDSLAVGKSVIPEQMEPSSNIEEGMISHMEVSDSSYNLNDDKDFECLVMVSSDQEPIAEFECDVANDMNSKIAGLQSYNFLPDSAGLLFPYQKPSNVLYHMGSVSFPIDIIFINSKNKIKKIYKNIKPGSLATFGCSDVTKVLEIVGGLSDRLGIKIGNEIQIRSKKNNTLNKFSNFHGVNKKIIIKYSNILNNGFSNFRNFPILTINDSSLLKNAKLSSSLIKNISIKKERYIGIYVDSLLDKGGIVSVFSKEEYDENKKCYSEIYGTASCINGERKVHYNDLILKKNETLLSGFKSLGTFIEPSIENRKIIKELESLSNQTEFDNKFIIFSKKNIKNLKELFLARINDEIGINKIKIIKAIQIDNIDGWDFSNSFFKKYGPNSCIISDDSLFSRAGVPVSENVKEQAKRIYKILKDSESLIEESRENISHNLSAYEKISTDFDKISATKGQYSESVKRQTKIVSKYLIKIRDSIRGLNKIKDVSTTMEIIDSLADSSKQAADIIEDIFDLIEYIEEPTFFDSLSEKTDYYKSACDDLLFNVDRAKDYINKNILGLKVLSK